MIEISNLAIAKGYAQDMLVADFAAAAQNSIRYDVKDACRRALVEHSGCHNRQPSGQVVRLKRGRMLEMCS
jgi:hypothetical protein